MCVENALPERRARSGRSPPTGNAIRIGFLAAHKIYPTATITLPPNPPVEMANFTLSQSPVDYSAQTTVLGADYSVHIAPMEFSSLLGNHGTIDCNLVPEAGTAPTATTDG